MTYFCHSVFLFCRRPEVQANENFYPERIVFEMAVHVCNFEFFIQNIMTEFVDQNNNGFDNILLLADADLIPFKIVCSAEPFWKKMVKINRKISSVIGLAHFIDKFYFEHIEAFSSSPNFLNRF